MGNSETIWDLEAQTEAKHSLLRRYLGAWFPIMSARNPKILFFDGCAGPGVYKGGDPGSPLIALETLVAHRHSPSMKSCDFLFLFNEEDPARFASLNSELEKFEKENAPWPRNINVYTECAEFQNTASNLVRDIGKDGRRLAPTFAFVDPFGFAGIPIEVLANLVQSPQCELFIFFAFDSLNRWISHPSAKIQAHLYELYGTHDYKDAADLSGEPRKKYLTDMYERQLREVAKLAHVQGFEMQTDRSRSYFLFHGTRHVSGVKAMKEAMWNLDPTGSYKFSARTSHLPILFGLDPDTAPEQAQIAKHFAGRTVRPKDVEDFLLTDTRLAAKHLRKLILKPLQEQGKITVAGQRRPFTYPERVWITFSSL